MQFSEGEWVFVNVGVSNGVSLIDPISGATPIFEDILQVGRRPVHIYRDPTDGQVMWTMLDGDAATGLDDVPATIADTNPPVVIDCSATGGGAVSAKSVFMLRGTRLQPFRGELVFPNAHLCPVKFQGRSR
jgi:hypothetical protein